LLLRRSHLHPYILLSIWIHFLSQLSILILSHWPCVLISHGLVLLIVLFIIFIVVVFLCRIVRLSHHIILRHIDTLRPYLLVLSLRRNLLHLLWPRVETFRSYLHWLSLLLAWNPFLLIRHSHFLLNSTLSSSWLSCLTVFSLSGRSLSSSSEALLISISLGVVSNVLTSVHF